MMIIRDNKGGFSITKIFILIIFILLIPTGNALNLDAIIEDKDFVKLFDIYKIDNIKDKDINLDLKIANTDFDIEILDTNYYYTVMNALLKELNPMLNPHLLAFSRLKGSDKIDYFSLQNSIYIVIYSLDELNSNVKGDHNYTLNSNVNYEAVDFNFELDYNQNGELNQNGDDILNDNEYVFYQYFIKAGQSIDIRVAITSESEAQLLLILGDFNNANDFIAAVEKTIEAINNNEDNYPSGVYGFDTPTIVNSDSYMGVISFKPSEDMILNIGLTSYADNNPKSVTYFLESSIEYESDPVTIDNVNYTNLWQTIIFGIVLISILSYVLIRDSYKKRNKLENTTNYTPKYYQKPISSPNLQSSFRSSDPAIQEEIIIKDNNSSIDGKSVLPSFCEYCGSRLKLLKNFCAKCGKAVRY